MAVQATTSQTFKSDVLDQKELVFVDFHAEWCGPCKMTEPIVHELSDEIKNMKFVSVDVDQAQDLASQYSVFSIPTFMIFKGGQPVAHFVGAMGKEGFLQEINKVTS